MSFRSSVDRAPIQCLDVMGSIPVGDSDFFFVPRSCPVDQFTFHISLPSLKFTTSLFKVPDVAHNDADVPDVRRVDNAINPVNMCYTKCTIP